MYRTWLVKLPPNARFSTVCLHAGQEPDPSTGAIVTPIYQTSTYVQEALNKHKGYEYGRTQNPTRLAVEQNLAAIEGGRAAFAFASGMAAIGAIATMLKAGDHVIVSEMVYGGTFRLFDKVFSRYQLSFSYVNTSTLDDVERAITPATRMLFLETPTNPLLALTDLRAAAELCRRRGLRMVVDNTFASPYNQRPLEFGADLVTHSTTKYLNGHSDSIGGVVIAMRDEDIEWLKFVQNAEGAILGPFDSWLVLRGTKTLALRMARHNENGLALATFLAGQPKIHRVYYPGLPDHPQHELAKRQMRGFGGMIACELGSLEAARRFLNALRLLSLAESLGGVETLISHPATMTHASIPVERRTALGISDGLVRISTGVEDLEDLREDISQALEKGLTVLDFILHSDKKLLEIVAQYGSWVYGFLFAIVFAETGFVVTPFLPGDSLLFATGALCATGALNAPTAIGLLVLAAFTGNAVNYAVGRAVGPRIFAATDQTGISHRLLNRDHLKRAHEFFEQYGGKAVILGRFVPIVRTFVPFVAGAAQMTSAAFVFFNIIGAAAWVVLCVGAGLLFGNVPIVKDNFSLVTIGIVLVSILPVVVEFLRARRPAA